tara:strand:+ start:241 stop:471 length:231 start_codon:yes stop_codon:yes gene_type:complete
MMSGGKDTAMIILGKNKKRSHQDEMMDDGMDYDDEDEEMEDYSEEQYEMADELITAVKGGNSERVLDAIHGIYNSY